MGKDGWKYCDIYRELADLIGEASTKKIWRRYAGVNISFPQRLYSKEYTKNFVAENIGKMKPADMARQLDLSERRIRQIIKEIKEEQGGKK